MDKDLDYLGRSKGPSAPCVGNSGPKTPIRSYFLEINEPGSSRRHSRLDKSTQIWYFCAISTITYLINTSYSDFLSMIRKVVCRGVNMTSKKKRMKNLSHFTCFKEKFILQTSDL